MQPIQNQSSPSVAQHQRQIPPDRSNSNLQEVQSPKKGSYQAESKPLEPKGDRDRLKSKSRIIAVGLILTISAVVFGLGLKEITAVKKETLVDKYNTSLDPFLAQSILIGILPIGSVFGACFAVKLIKHCQRLFGMYIFTVVLCLGVGLVNVNSLPAVTAGRFIEGISIGFFSAVAPIYMREIAPKQLRKTLGLFFSLGKVVGVLVSIMVELILSPMDLQYAYRINLSLTAPFSLIQLVLIFLFTTPTPTELVEKGQREQAYEVIKQLYRKEFVEEVLREYIQEHQADLKKAELSSSKPKQTAEPLQKDQIQGVESADKQGMDKKAATNKIARVQFAIQDYGGSHNNLKESSNSRLGEEQMEGSSGTTSVVADEPELTFHDKKKIAHCLGVNICILRHFTGGNTVVTQGGIFISNFNASLGHYSPLIINLIQLVAVIFGLVVIPSVMGKKPLFLLTLSLLTLLNLAFTVSMIYEEVLAMIILMSMHTTVYGIFINATWGYPSEVIPASQALPSNLLHWIALSLATLVPPMVSRQMPNLNPYPVFIFFAVYTFIGFLHVRFYLRETDGLTYKQIIESLR